MAFDPRDFRDAILAAVRQVLREQPDRLRRATVREVSGGRVSLGWPGTDALTTNVSYNATYSPRVGDEVYVETMRSGLWVVGAIFGRRSTDQPGDGSYTDYKATRIRVVGTNTGSAGSAAEVENVGTDTDAQLLFTVPRGYDGVAAAQAPVTYDSETRTVGVNRLLGRVRGEGAMPPSSGTWVVGDLWWNTQPIGGGVIGWVYTMNDGWCPWGAIFTGE